MAVAVNLIPVTGQPLPLISRGGTSTLITCAYFGLILSADRFGNGKKKMDEKSLENEYTDINEKDDEDNYSDPESNDNSNETIDRLEDKVELEIVNF